MSLPDAITEFVPHGSTVVMGTCPEAMIPFAAAREITDGEVIFVGMRSPLLGFLLAKSNHAPQATGIYELGFIRDTVAPEPILAMPFGFPTWRT